jgi:hypothetical protein
MEATSIWSGIVIGAAGGSIAGLSVYLSKYVHEKLRDLFEKKRIYKWLSHNTQSKDGGYKSTYEIASWCNLTPDRVRYLCSQHKKIYLQSESGDDGNWWSIYQRSPELF